MRPALALVLSILLFPAPLHADAPGPLVAAPSALVLDGWSGVVLWQRGADVQRDPASTTKIMTALVILRRHIPLDRVVTVGEDAATYGGSTAGLVVGERLTVWNLLHGMLLPSGNDAALALADATAGSAPAFVSLMNGEARRLHLWHTHYLTPNGYDRWGQVTTALDLAHLARIAMENATFARIVRTRYWTARSVDGSYVHRWVNLNKLLWSSRHVDGIKTGTTPGAGACLVSSARFHHRWVIAVTLGGTEATRFRDGASLLNYGLSVAAPMPSVR